MDDAKFEHEIEKELAELEIENQENGDEIDQIVEACGFEDSDAFSDSLSVTSNSLLRATICELERALKDTRRLLLDRDKRITEVRLELEKTRKELHKEQKQKKKLRSESDKSLNDLKEVDQKEVEKLRREMGELKEKLEKSAIDTQVIEDGDEIIPCCSSMNELIEVKQKLKETQQQLSDFKANNQLISDQRFDGKRDFTATPRAQKQCQKELQTQLRLKFLRDAFFYYMIDFHSEEQMKAILAILDYDDRRHDIIIESHNMRRQGKRFTVTEVSSRSLTFVQETS